MVRSTTMPPASVRATTSARHSVRYASSRNKQSVVISMPSHERSFDAGAALEPFGHRQLLGAQELGIEQLRLVARAVVGEHGDDGVPRAHVLGEPDRAGDVDAR